MQRARRGRYFHNKLNTLLFRRPNKSIANARLVGHKRMIWGNLDGWDHVKSLLVARGVDPARLRVGAKRKSCFSRKQIMRQMVVDAL